MSKVEEGHGLIAVATHGSILATKWVVRCIEGAAPWHTLFWHRMMTTQCLGKV
jgi:hypothetical protein